MLSIFHFFEPFKRGDKSRKVFQHRLMKKSYGTPPRRSQPTASYKNQPIGHFFCFYLFSFEAIKTFQKKVNFLFRKLTRIGFLS